jgi:hypothetical protein
MATRARIRFAAIVAVVAAPIATSACSLISSFDGLTDGGEPVFVHDAGHDVEIIDALPIEADAGPDGGDACAPGTTMCVPSPSGGAESSLLQCVNGFEQTTACQYGCVMQVDASATAPTPVAVCSPCFLGGKYCGGDKIGTDPKTLYICNPDGTAGVVENCLLGCKVNPSGDDSCQ